MILAIQSVAANIGFPTGVKIDMPYYVFKEKWTPLRLVGLKLYVDDEGRLWWQLWGSRRKRFR